MATTHQRLFAFVLTLVAWLVVAPTAHAVEVPRPGQHEHVLDLADMLDAKAEAEIREVADALLVEHATPIVVVTIDSMAAHGGAGMRIETFTQILFDEWGVGHPTLAGASWDTGILLVISKSDRAARIQLGAGWGRDHDAETQRIMDERIVPRFKSGDFSGGTIAGVRALDGMARGKALPVVRDGTETWWWIAVAIVTVLAIASAVSLVRSGRGGIAWVVWAAVFGVLAFILVHTRRRRACSGGGFRGGSFGGGRSGGGGATGRW